MPRTQSGNWVIETSTTTGTGSLLLTGAIDLAHTSFQQTLNAGDVYYTILDGDNREAGLGTFNGVNQLVRTTVLNTLVNGVYIDVNPTPINLSGTQVVANTFNATSYRELFDHLSDNGDPHNVIASQVDYDPASDPTSSEINVQDALVDHGTSIEQRVASVSGIISGGFITGSVSQFSVTSGTGEIFDSFTSPNNTSIIEVSWLQQANIVLQTNYPSGVTRIFMGSNGVVFQFTNDPTHDLFRDYISLGLITYVDGIITDVTNTPSVVKQTSTDLYDLLQHNIVIDGLNVFPVDDELQTWIDKGNIFYPGANWYNNIKIPNNITLAQDGTNLIPITYTPITQDGTNFTPIQDYPLAWNPTGSTITNLTGNDATIHRLYRLGVENPTYFMLYGQNLYTDTKTAKDNLFIDGNNTVYPDIVSNMTLIAHVGVNDNANDFDNINNAWIVSTLSKNTTSSSAVSTSHTSLSDREIPDQHPISAITGGAPLESPNFTGIPTAPTAIDGTDTTQIASTAFVLANAGVGGGDRNVDGGKSDSVYLPSQIIDGGTASG